MSFAASVITNSVSTTLLDTANYTWSLTELLEYLTEGLQATAALKPNSYITEVPFTPVAGTNQTLPADGVLLIDIQRNTGGRIVTQVDKELLDESTRFWPNSTPSAIAQHFTYDPRNPLNFVLFPPSTGTGASLDLVYAAVPPTVTTSGQTINLVAAYVPALIDYVLSRAYAKNSKRQDLSKAQTYLGQWAQKMGGKATAEAAAGPQVDREEGTE